MATRYAINSDDEDERSQPSSSAGPGARAAAAALARAAANANANADAGAGAGGVAGQARDERMDEDLDVPPAARDAYMLGIDDDDADARQRRAGGTADALELEDVALSPQRRRAARQGVGRGGSPGAGRGEGNGSSVSALLSPSPRRAARGAAARAGGRAGGAGAGAGGDAGGTGDALLDNLLADIEEGDRQFAALSRAAAGQPQPAAGGAGRYDDDDDEDDDASAPSSSAARVGGRARSGATGAGAGDTFDDAYLGGRRPRTTASGGGLFAGDMELEAEDSSKAAIEKLREAWVAEKCCPELRPFSEETFDRVVEQIESQQSIIDSLGSDESTSEEEHFRLSLVMLDMERARWLLRAYLRARLGKVEAYSQYIRASAPERRKLSGMERAYVARFEALRTEHLNASVLDLLPPNLRALDDEAMHSSSAGDMVAKPDLDQPVFIRCRVACGRLVLPDGSHAELSKGSVHMVRYSLVRHLLDLGRISLM